MNAPRCRDLDYIQFLVASPRVYSCTEAARVQPDSPRAPAHDAFTRLLHRIEPDPETLWDEARPLVERAKGVLVIDDSTLDKHHARRIDSKRQPRCLRRSSGADRTLPHCCLRFAACRRA